MAAFLRGINVGKAKRVAMADLRAVVADLGYGDVRTLLNSGNVTFRAPGVEPKEAARRIQEALAERTGVTSRTIAFSSAELRDIVADNALAATTDNPSRLLVWMFDDPSQLAPLEPLAAQDWAPEALVVGRHAAYIWCNDGIAKSRVVEDTGRLLGDSGTARNWATIQKIHAILNPADAVPPAG